MSRLNKTIHILMLCFCISCNQGEKHKNDDENYSKKREIYIQLSLQESTRAIYNSVYKSANDSIKTWVDNSLKRYMYQKDNDWQLDDLICFNKNADKSIMALITRDTLFKKSVSDGLQYFYGVKIKEKWYFFSGATIVLPREYYQKDIHTPLSFDQLHKIALKKVFRGYLKKNKAGEWEINERFFGDIDRILAIHKGKFKTEEEWERWWTKSVIEANWSRRDTSLKKLQ